MTIGGGDVGAVAAGESENVSHAFQPSEIAKRKAVEPLKPKVGQKPADEGLFSDWVSQTDLVELAGRPKAAKP